MSYSIKIPREFYNKGERIFDKGTLTFEPGITVLIGCNGSGKSTILRHIKDHCRREDIPVLYYDNFTEDIMDSCKYFIFPIDIALLFALLPPSVKLS